MVRRKRECPHCKKITEQNMIERIPPGITQGLEYLPDVKTEVLQTSTWFCLDCFRCHTLVWKENSEVLDLRSLVKKVEGPKK